ncbi:MAG: hypothetical protein Q8Q30_01420 [Candidatus Woesebacteria bacterium]|nr:hypothetical protein [Candidatus Woesebacteria bacterium]
MQNVISFFTNLSVAPVYIKAGIIVVLLFLLVISLAVVRKYFVISSLKGVFVGLFFGFLLALFLEGFLLIAGKTAVTELLGWKDAPKPIKTALDMGHEKLVNVLGVSDQIPQSYASIDPTIDDAVNTLQNLDPTEISKIKAIICTP